MLQAHELRIGNWVKVYGDHITQCKGIEMDRFAFTSKSSAEETASLTQVDPILITPEILSRCGLSDQSWIKTYTPISLRATPQGYDVITVDEKRIAVLKYVHQLQNLYFALIGQELEIHW